MNDIDWKRPYFRRLIYLSAVLLVFSFSDQLEYTSAKQVAQTELSLLKGGDFKKVSSIFYFESFSVRPLTGEDSKIKFCLVEFQNKKYFNQQKSVNKDFLSKKESITSRWSNFIQKNSNYLA